MKDILKKCGIFLAGYVAISFLMILVFLLFLLLCEATIPLLMVIKFCSIFGIYFTFLSFIIMKSSKNDHPKKACTVKIERGTATYDPAFNHFIKISTMNPIHFGSESVLVLKEDLEKILNELEKET